MINRMTPRPGTYKQTKLHRQHVSAAIKKWWSNPLNKKRMSEIQTGLHRRKWSEKSRKQLSDSMKRYYRNKHRKEREVRDNDKD